MYNCHHTLSIWTHGPANYKNIGSHNLGSAYQEVPSSYKLAVVVTYESYYKIYLHSTVEIPIWIMSWFMKWANPTYCLYSATFPASLLYHAYSVPPSQAWARTRTHAHNLQCYHLHDTNLHHAILQDHIRLQWQKTWVQELCKDLTWHPIPENVLTITMIIYWSYRF
jgi:hypothetical protein